MACFSLLMYRMSFGVTSSLAGYFHLETREAEGFSAAPGLHGQVVHCTGRPRSEDAGHHGDSSAPWLCPNPSSPCDPAVQEARHHAQCRHDWEGLGAATFAPSLSTQTLKDTQGRQGNLQRKAAHILESKSCGWHRQKGLE